METRSSKRLLVADKKNKTNTETRENSLWDSHEAILADIKEKQKAQSATEKEPDISSLPLITFNGRINFVSEFNDCAMTCDNIITEVENCESETVPIGFDLEWPFSFQTGSGKTALVQICLNETVCHLLHVYSLNKLPAAFVILLTHPKVKLVGVNIKNDLWKLGRDFREFPAFKAVENCVDSGPYANRVLNRSCRWSLERLTAHLLKKRIDKTPKVRKSKWHIQPLSKEQKVYAATDAYVSWLLHTTIQKLASMKEQGDQ